MTNKTVARLSSLRLRNPSDVLRELEAFAASKGFTNYTVEEVTPRSHPLVYAVNKGSKNPAYVVKLNFDKKGAKTVVVGKGVVYDSGGYYMKPKAMESMFLDKTGAMLAFVYGVETGNPAILYLNSNLVSEESMLNGEVYTGLNGKKVLIAHSDAEGRLGLGDILVEAEKAFPDATAVSVATLTGHACQVSGGVQLGLIHTSKEDLQIFALKEFNKTTVTKGKTDRPFKLYPYHQDDAFFDKKTKSPTKDADITNDSSGTGGAYAFLRNFHSNLVHLDIAPMDELFAGTGDSAGLGLHEIKEVVRFLESRKK